jgi:protein-tyrosine phosphatase
VTTLPDPTAVDRAIAFATVFNVRDLGGLPTEDGRVVRRGRVFRADGVDRLDGEDLEVARTLGLRTVIDLRTFGEIERSTFPAQRLAVAWHHLPILEGMWSEQDLVPTSGAVDFLRQRYLDMLVEGRDSIVRALELVADEGPVLFHCAAGKDRTGVLAAVVLGLVGAAPEVIAEDYHLSAAAMDSFVDWLALEHPEWRDAMSSQPPEYLAAPPEAMLGLLTEVDRRHGSMQALVAALGVPTEVVARLRANLLDDVA